MESKAVNYHDEDGKMFDKFQLKAGDDAGDVKWLAAECTLELYANHCNMIEKVAHSRGAHF